MRVGDHVVPGDREAEQLRLRGASAAADAPPLGVTRV
jgi:hypothetical protein